MCGATLARGAGTLRNLADSPTVLGAHGRCHPAPTARRGRGKPDAKPTQIETTGSLQPVEGGFRPLSLPTANGRPPETLSVNHRHDDRSPSAVAYSWAIRISTIAAERVVPGLIGHAVDRWLGLPGVFVLLGFLGGMTWGMWHLLRITAQDAKKEDKS